MSLWQFAFMAFLPLLCFVGCNKSPTTQESLGPDEEAMVGGFDVVDANFISGWAWDSRKPDTPIEVDIFDGDKKLTTIRADVFREDLVKEDHIGNGKHAFNYATPQSLKDGKSHTIRVRITGTDKELEDSPKTFKSR
jgi:hypothetical protein